MLIIQTFCNYYIPQLRGIFKYFHLHSNFLKIQFKIFYYEGNHLKKFEVIQGFCGFKSVKIKIFKLKIRIFFINLKIH